MPTLSRIARLEKRLSPRHRYVNLCLTFRRRATGEALHTVGGRWDRRGKRYVGECPPVFVDLNESQIEMFMEWRAWLKLRLAADPDRPIILFAGGTRGGGKTHLMVALLVATALAVPGARFWIVNPTHKARDEIKVIWKDLFPERWSHWSEKWLTWNLANGSTVPNISGEIPANVKAGGVEIIFVNEAQLQSQRIYSLGLPAVRNTEQRPVGVMFIATNPPNEEGGDEGWPTDVREGILTGKIQGVYCDVDPTLNASIEQPMLDAIGAAVRFVDQQQADSDIDNSWRRGNQAYPAFSALDANEVAPDKGGHLGRPPTNWPDITREFTAKKTGRAKGWPRVALCDFQRKPHVVAMIMEMRRRPDGKHAYVFVDEIIARGDEHDLSDALYDRDYVPADLLIVADSSGAWQAIRRGEEGHYSHVMLRERGWTVLPVALPKHADKAPSGAGRNPDLEQSLPQVHAALTGRRVFFVPRTAGVGCEWVIECMRRCRKRMQQGSVTLDKRGQFDAYTHASDCVRYGIWWGEPPPGRRSAPPQPGSFRPLKAVPAGPRML